MSKHTRKAPATVPPPPAPAETSGLQPAAPLCALHVPQLDAVRAAMTEITREPHLSKLVPLITQRAVEVVGATAGVLFLWDEGSQVLVPRAHYGPAGT